MMLSKYVSGGEESHHNLSRTIRESASYYCFELISILLHFSANFSMFPACEDFTASALSIFSKFSRLSKSQSAKSLTSDVHFF